MDTPISVKSLLDMIGKEKIRFHSEARKHKRLHRFCQTGIICLTAATTITSGLGLILPEVDKNIFQFVVLCLTAATTGLLSWQEMRHARDLWQHETAIYHSLLDIEREIMYLSSTGTIEPPAMKEYFKNINALLASSSTKWEGIVKTKS
ncbi:hypothetical protein IAD21_01214 [Abditibacteriota bacterium]|nr:hypothetical protein IAD21_01214 [Abditibacteriota bacterium]